MLKKKQFSKPINSVSSVNSRKNLYMESDMNIKTIFRRNSIMGFTGNLGKK